MAPSPCLLTFASTALAPARDCSIVLSTRCPHVGTDSLAGSRVVRRVGYRETVPAAAQFAYWADLRPLVVPSDTVWVTRRGTSDVVVYANSLPHTLALCVWLVDALLATGEQGAVPVDDKGKGEGSEGAGLPSVLATMFESWLGVGTNPAVPPALREVALHCAHRVLLRVSVLAEVAAGCVCVAVGWGAR